MGGWDYYPMVHAADSEASSHKIYSMLSKLCTICQAVGRREGGREGLQRRGQTSRGQTNRMTKQGIQDSSIIAAGSLVNKLLVRAGKFRECRRKCSTNHTHPNSPTLEQSFEYCCTRKIKEEKENH